MNQHRQQRQPRTGRLLVAIPAIIIATAAGCTREELAAFVGFDFGFNLPIEFVQPQQPPADSSFDEQPLFEEKPIFDTIPGRNQHHGSTLVAFDDGELMAAWYASVGPEELDGAAIYTARRRPGAEAWGTPHLHIDRPVGDGNPVLFAEGDRMWLFQAVVPLGWATAHVEFQRSFDRGITWTPAKVIDGPLGTNVRAPPLRLHDGTLLLPAYDDLFLRTLFFTSENGSDWQLQPIVEHEENDGRPIQPSVTQLDSGRLLAVMRNTAQNGLWVMASEDRAQSWTRPRNSGFPNPGSPAVVMKLASGRLILVYNDRETDRLSLSVALSDDEGETWPIQRAIARGEDNYSYPAVAQTPDGRIHVVYSLSRRTIQHVTFNEAWVAGE